jgi:hypothetical protein
MVKKFCEKIVVQQFEKCATCIANCLARNLMLIVSTFFAMTAQAKLEATQVLRDLSSALNILFSFKKFNPGGWFELPQVFGSACWLNHGNCPLSSDCHNATKAIRDSQECVRKSLHIDYRAKNGEKKILLRLRTVVKIASLHNARFSLVFPFSFISTITLPTYWNRTISPSPATTSGSCNSLKNCAFFQKLL